MFELKVPPVAVAVLIALIMGCASSATAWSIEVPLFARAIAAAVLAVAGAGIGLAGVASFRRASTTLNPMRPAVASALVGSGIYRVSRNPMYLGLLLALFAWAAYLSNALAVICATLFVPYMNRYQIAPEERALAALFGAQFEDYKSRVRRWL